jgi:hypothetical protein
MRIRHTVTDTAIVEQRADLEPPCRCRAWARFIEPGVAPRFGDATWDAAGTGLWLAFSDGPLRWLSHLDAPLHDTKVADLPPNATWRILGISPDDRWVVLGDEEADLGPLALVDTAAGESRILARPDASGVTPFFAGWVR